MEIVIAAAVLAAGLVVAALLLVKRAPGLVAAGSASPTTSRATTGPTQAPAAEPADDGDRRQEIGRLEERLVAREAALETRAAKLGFIALTDAAPLFVADEKGLFKKHGMTEVEVLKQSSWGTTRDNLVLGSRSGGIDGAHILTPMPYLIASGATTANNVQVPMNILARLNLGGQCIIERHQRECIGNDKFLEQPNGKPLAGDQRFRLRQCKIFLQVLNKAFGAVNRTCRKRREENHIRGEVRERKFRKASGLMVA